MNSKIAAVKQAIAAGRRKDALIVLRDLVKEEPNNIHAWLYLAGLAPNAQARESCLRRAEAIDPDHPLIQKARQWTRPTPVAAVEADAAEATTAAAPIAVSALPTVAAARELQQAPTPIPAATVPVPPSPQTQPRSTNRIIWITAAAVAALLLVTAGGLLVYSGWFDTLWASEPAAEAVVAELPLLAEVVEAENAGVEIEAATPHPDHDRYSNDGRQAVIVANDNGAGAPSGKLIVAGGEVRERWTVTPSPTHTPTPTPSPTATPTIPPTFVSQSADIVPPVFLGENERWIDVNLTTQTLNAYEGNKLVFSTLISSGLAQYPTVTGQFRIYLEYDSQTMDGRYLGYDYVVENVPYVLYFYQGYAIHGAYWHNNFGNPMSHGCVNMEVSEAQWIYQWAGIGTLVNVHY